MAQFPNAVISFTTKNSGDVIQASHINDMQAEITAIEDGYINGTARLNSSKSTLATLSVTGGSTVTTLQAGASTIASINVTGTLGVTGNSTLASTITIGTIPYLFPSSGGSTGQVLTCVSTSGSTMGIEWRTPQGLSLLKANSGTDSNAGAFNVDTFAVTGLTAKDILHVWVGAVSVTQATASLVLYNNTDGVTIVTNVAGATTIIAGETHMSVSEIMQSQTNSTSVWGLSKGRATTAGIEENVNVASFATPWTGSWTLALRHGGVTAGGQLQWRWAIYKVAGQ